MFLDLCSMHFVCVCVRSHQKLASRAKSLVRAVTPTPDFNFKYSPTRFLEKFVFPCKLIVSERFQLLALGEFIG